MMLSCVVANLLAVVLAIPAQAGFGGGGALTAPFVWGIGGSVEVQPYGILLGLEVGQVPGFFAALQGRMVQSNGGSDLDGKLAMEAMTNTAVVQLRAGYKPFPKRGLELWAGYGLGFLGGGALSQEDMEDAAGMSSDVRSGPLATGFVTTAHHSVHGLVAWTFRGERMFTRIGAGYLAVVASSSSVSASSGAPSFRRAVEKAMDSAVTSYLRTPLLHLTIGYSL